jgi:hypothetical protein
MDGVNERGTRLSSTAHTEADTGSNCKESLRRLRRMLIQTQKKLEEEYWDTDGTTEEIINCDSIQWKQE